MEPLESPLGGTKVFGWGKKFTVASDGQMVQSKVDPNNPASCRKGFLFYLAGETGVPLSGLLTNGQGLDLALDAALAEAAGDAPARVNRRPRQSAMADVTSAHTLRAV